MNDKIQKDISKIIKKSIQQEIKKEVFKTRERVPKYNINVLVADEVIAHQFIAYFKEKGFKGLLDYCEVEQYNSSKSEIRFYGEMGV